MIAPLRSSAAATALFVAGIVSKGAGPIVVAAGNLRNGVAQVESMPLGSVPGPLDDSLPLKLFSIPTVIGEPVDCQLAPGDDGDGKKLVMLTSSGLGVWGSDGGIVPNPNLTFGFRDLVLQLPDAAWAGGEGEGIQRKANAADRSTQWLTQNNFLEADLYKGLDVVIINDACILKDSFWNAENPNFSPASGNGLNHLIAGMRTSPEVVRPFFGEHLDGGWCVNFAADRPGYLGSLGFEPARVHQVSLWDTLASPELAQELLKLRAGQEAPHPSDSDIADMSTDAAKELMSRLAAADVVIANGGNPDLLAYVLERFAREAMAPVLENVQAGRTIWLGQSAGAMVAGADMGLSYENSPGLLEHLRNFNTSGLGLAGTCAIRPHVKDKSWSLTASVYGKLRHVSMVLVPNGNALRCCRGSCSRIGAPGAPAAKFSGPEDPRLERLTAAFAPAVAAQGGL